MSNRFYTFLNSFIPGSVAKSSEVNSQLQQLEVGFDNTELEVNTAIKFPASESATNTRMTEVAASRANKLLQFNASGTPEASSTLRASLNAGGFVVTNVGSPVAATDAVTLGYLGTYSLSLSGVPSPAGSIGAMVSTDGAAASWVAQGTNSGFLLPTFPNGTSAAWNDYSGHFLTMNRGAPTWAPNGINLIFDPNGYRGSQFWTTGLDSTYNQKGYYWKNIGALAAATFDHTPTSDGFITCSPAINLTFSGRMLANTSAGTITILFEHYDSGYALISSSTPTTITPATSVTSFNCTTATPAGTAYVKPVVRFVGVTANAGAIEYRNPKVERGLSVSPFTDDFTLGWIVSYRETYYDGYNYANPRYVLGNGSAVTATQDFRSTTGTQDYDVRIRSTGGTNGTAGKGTLTLTAAKVVSVGPIGYSGEYDAGNVGAALTVSWANGSRQKCTLNAATPTITINTPPVVGHYQLKLIQDPAIARVVSWAGFAAGDCQGGSLPVITTTLSGVTFLFLYYDGTNLWVSSSDWS